MSRWVTYVMLLLPSIRMVIARTPATAERKYEALTALVRFEN